MARVLMSAAAIILVLVAAIWLAQRRLMYFPDRDVLPPARVGLEAVEEVRFTTADGVRLHGWFVAAERPRFTVIVFNGNAGNRAYRGPLAAALRAQGHSVLLFDYRGFGESGGSPTESGLAEDARAAREQVTMRADVDAARVVYFGESLGTAVATRLAAEHPPAALILRSPFASMTEVGRFHYPMLPVSLLLRDRYASVERIGTVHCPLLVIAGDRDRIIPLAHSRALFDAAAGPKRLVVIPGADHNDESLFAGRRMMDAIREFLEGNSGSGGPPGTLRPPRAAETTDR